MGVPKFYGYLKRHYTHVIINRLPNVISNLYVDLNGYIHPQAAIFYGYASDSSRTRTQAVKEALERNPELVHADFFIFFQNALTNLVNTLQPRDGLYLMTDGLPPVGKMNQQRRRRYMSVLNPKPIPFDSNMISPGTNFMYKLDGAINEWLSKSHRAPRESYKQYKTDDNQMVNMILYQHGNYLPPNVVYSNHLVPGEGEHKIMDAIRPASNLASPGVVSVANSDKDLAEHGEAGALLIWGKDADLIFLSLLTGRKHIYIAREDIEDIVDIDALRTTIINMVLGRMPIEVVETFDNETIIADYVLIMTLLGNDFLPKISALSDMNSAIDILLETYMDNAKHLTSQGHDNLRHIVWPNFASFLQLLATKEQALLQAVAIMSYRYTSPIYDRSVVISTESDATSLTGIREKKVLHYSTYRNLWYQHVFANRKPSTVLTKVIGSDPFSYDGADYLRHILHMGQQYLLTLAWVFTYYQSNLRRIDYTWAYPYLYAPLLYDLKDVAAQLQDNNIVMTNNGNYKSYNVWQQLLAILPFSSRELLPTPYRKLLNNNSPIIDTFPQNIMLEKYAINEDWEALAILGPINMARIASATADIKLTIKQRGQLAEQNALILFRERSKSELYELQRRIAAKDNRELDKIANRKYTQRSNDDYHTASSKGYHNIEQRGGSNRSRGRSNRGRRDRDRGSRDRGSRGRGGRRRDGRDRGGRGGDDRSNYRGRGDRSNYRGRNDRSNYRGRGGDRGRGRGNWRGQSHSSLIPNSGEKVVTYGARGPELHYSM